MTGIIQALFSLNLIGVLLWAMWVEYRLLRQKARQR